MMMTLRTAAEHVTRRHATALCLIQLATPQTWTQEPSRVQGYKSDAERFAGALFTMSVEGFVPATGRGIQVSHYMWSLLLAWPYASSHPYTMAASSIGSRQHNKGCLRW